LDATGGVVERSARDWNNEFQTLWTEQVHGEICGFDRTTTLQTFLEEFELHARTLVELHMTTREEARAMRLANTTGLAAAVVPTTVTASATPSPAVRYGNLFVYVWPDAKAGMWMQRSYRALLECRASLLRAPLLATFRYFNEVVTVAAAVAFDRTKVPEYTGNGRCDPVVHTPLQEHISLVRCALNLVPDEGRCDSGANSNSSSKDQTGGTTHGSAAGGREFNNRPQQKIRGIEVREGMDMRLYLTNAMGLLPPIFTPTGGPLTLRRWWHLVKHPPMPWGSPATADVYKRDAAATIQNLPSLLELPVEKRNAQLVELLHDGGLNVCLLGLIALTLMSNTKEELEDTTEGLLQVICTEMLARAVRRAMFSTMKQERATPTVKAVNAYLERTAGSILSGTSDRFKDGLLPVLRDCFWFDGSFDTAPLIARLKYTLHEEPTHVMKRVCQLCGLQVMRGVVTEVLCTASQHNYRTLFSASHEALLSTLRKDRATYSHSFTCAFLVPLRICFFSRSGRMQEAWQEVRRLLELCGRRLSDKFLNAQVWTMAAVLAAHCGQPEAESAMLISRAADVMNSIPAYVVQSTAVQVKLPTYLYYLTGQSYVKTAHGFLLLQQNKLEAAEEVLEEALRLPDVVEPERQYFLGHLRQQAILGLFAIATRSGEAKVRQFDAQWSNELRKMAPTLQGARISELFGSLFFERGMCADAVGRLWECLETTEQLLGPTALRVGEVLNKLAYVYYCWDARQYGLFCSCILHRAEEIMKERAGLYSALHLSVAENIISLFIQRGMFVEASQRLHELRTLPARYTAHLSRDHPAITRIAEIAERLRHDFRPFAIDIIRRCWREYHSRLLVRAECERNVREIQRVGRAYLVRRLMVRLYYGTITPDYIAQCAQTYSMLSFSRPLVAASALFDKDERHWNSEAQQLRLFIVAWDRLEQLTVKTAMARIEDEFAAAAKKYLLEMRSGEQRGVPVAGCSTSVVLHNMVFTKVPAHHRLSTLQACVMRFLRRHLQFFVTAPLSTIVEFPDCGYYVEGLLPLHHQPQFVFTSDGGHGVRHSQPIEDCMRYLVRLFSEANLTVYQAEAWQGIEVVYGADGLVYVTNGLGLVSTAVHQLDLIVSDDTLPQDHFLAAWQLWGEGNMKEAVEMLEHTLLNHRATEHGAVQMFLLVYFAFARFALGDDDDAAMRLFQRCMTALVESGLPVVAALVSHAEGRAWLQRDSPKLAVEPLMRALRILKKQTHLHAYYGSFYLLETAHWILLASGTREAALEEEVLMWFAHTVEFGEPTLRLFTTCGRFIVYAHRINDTALWQKFVKLRDMRAKELQPAERDRFVRVLQEHSEDLQRRGGTESCKDCAFLLQTAIRLAEAGSPESRQLGVLLTSYGFLLTTMDRLKEARRFLRRANAILTKTVSSASPEMMTWHKNNRVLMHRVRENAIRVIRRAVWRWKERRRLDKKMEETDPAGYRTLLAVRYQRRLNRVVVLEATARVLIAEAQSEEWYRLLRRQGRMRNDAMLKQTYGSRVQVFDDKITAALADLTELALATKAVMADTAWRIRCSIMTAFVLTGHRLERRATIAEWHRERLFLKLWHIEDVDMVIRAEFLAAFHGYVARCVSAEERAWRRIIQRNQKKTKRQMAKAIVHALHRKPKSAAADLRSLQLDEARKRERITWREDEDFRQLRDAFTFGPVVEDVDDAEAEGDDSEDSWQG
jgi:tetratricopeptide (TPR) repeat protein